MLFFTSRRGAALIGGAVLWNDRVEPSIDNKCVNRYRHVPKTGGISFPLGSNTSPGQPTGPTMPTQHKTVRRMFIPETSQPSADGFRSSVILRVPAGYTLHNPSLSRWLMRPPLLTTSGIPP